MELDQSQQPMRRSSGRRKGGGGGEKKRKQPRRGMGVAKLEQLREQTEAPPPLPVYHNLQYSTWNPVGFPGFFEPAGSDRRLLQLGSDESVFKCYSLHCSICYKKKRLINGDQIHHNVLNQERPQNLGNYGKKVEVVAVHRNWEGGSHQGVLMEYDFFPPPPPSAEAVDGGGGFVRDSTVGRFDGSNCLDLSLKLSY